MRAPDLAAIATAAAHRAKLRNISSPYCNLAKLLEEWEEPTIDAATLLDMCCSVVRTSSGSSGTFFFKNILDMYVTKVGLPVDVPAVGDNAAASYMDAKELFDMVVELALQL